MSGPEQAPADVVTTPERRRDYERRGLWNGETLAGLVAEHARARPGSLAVADLGGRRERTYAELDGDANRMANRLLGLGVTAGDVVSAQLPNWYETVVVQLAILKLGAVLNPMLPIYRAHELRHMLGVGRVGVVVTASTYRSYDYVAMIESIRADLPALRDHIVLEDPGSDPDAFARELAEWPDTAPETPLDAAAVSELMFTSGTEAEPKAVLHTEQTTGFSARAAASALALGDGDVIWMPSPIGHSTGFNYGVRVALHLGLPLVLQDRWSAADAAQLVERYRATYTVAATTFLADLVAHRENASEDLSSLRLFGSGGSAVPPELVAAAAMLGITVLRLYGSTEALVATWNRPESPREKRVETDGTPLDGVELEVRAESGEPVIGEPGEIFVRGPATTVGFFADPERTAAAIDADGWLRLGDLGVLDEDGYLTIVGRVKEILIRGGLNIAPREIEQLILLHPAVADVAVVGLPDPRLGELTCACAVLRDGASLSFEDLVAFLKRQGLATFKLPERLERVDELPRTPTGKVQRFELVAQIAGPGN